MGGYDRAMANSGAPLSPRFHFRRRQRLAHAREFQAIFGAKVRRSRGPLTVFGRPNGMEHARLGLSVGRRVGNAVTRNALKRRLREAFRLAQHALPKGFDFVVSAHPHEGATAEDYGRWLGDAAAGVAREWARREASSP